MADLFVYLAFLILVVFLLFLDNEELFDSRQKRGGLSFRMQKAQALLHAYSEEPGHARGAAFKADVPLEETEICSPEPVSERKQEGMPMVNQNPPSACSLTPETALSAMALSVVLGPPAARKLGPYR